MSDRKLQKIREKVFQWKIWGSANESFSPRMWHHAGRPTTGHISETIRINSSSPQVTDSNTVTPHKLEIKAGISPKNDLDFPSEFSHAFRHAFSKFIFRFELISLGITWYHSKGLFQTNTFW